MRRNVLLIFLAVAVAAAGAVGRERPRPAMPPRLPTVRPPARPVATPAPPPAAKPAPPATQPAAPAARPAAAAAAGAAALQATVVSVAGLAERRLAAQPDGTWQPIKAGDVLGQTSLVRTGFGSKVVLRLADRGVVTLRSCTKIGIGTFLKQGQTVRANVGIKYGAIRAKIDRSRGPNDFSVSTPTATLSVRGSEGDIAHWGDLLTNAKIHESGWRFQVGGRTVVARPGELIDGRLTPWHVLGPALAYVAITDPFGSTATEIWNVLNNGTNRGIFNFDASRIGAGTIPTPPIPSTDFRVTIIPRKVP